MRHVFKVIFVMILVLGAGCSGTSSPQPESTPTPEQAVQQAWKDFEAGRYESAIAGFTNVFNFNSSAEIRGEAMSGRGWSYAYQRAFEKAKSDFLFAVGLSGITTNTSHEVRVGHALVLHAVNDFSGAIVLLNGVLTERPTYSFAHDPKVSAKRLRVVLAQSYYATGEFALAAAQLDLFDPSKAPHSSDPPILLQLIAAALNSL